MKKTLITPDTTDSAYLLKPETNKRILKALSTSDPRLGLAIKEIGPCKIEIEPTQTPFESLARAIAYQQLTGKAAKTIYDRFQAKFSIRTGLCLTKIARAGEHELRECGLSLAKAKAIQDLASKTIERQIPSFDQLARLTDDEIVEITTRVRGVGIWTAQMFLIFRLGRLDVMPSTDYGVRKGFARLYLKAGADLPEPQEIEKHARLWQPYRSVASWYMWRVLELESWLK